MAKRMWDKEELIQIAEEHGGGGGEPAEYLKEATVSGDGNTLTLTKKDGTEVEFSPEGGGGGSVEIDGKTIIENADGELETAIGGYKELDEPFSPESYGTKTGSGYTAKFVFSDTDTAAIVEYFQDNVNAGDAFNTKWTCWPTGSDTPVEYTVNGVIARNPSATNLNITSGTLDYEGTTNGITVNYNTSTQAISIAALSASSFDKINFEFTKVFYHKIDKNYLDGVVKLGQEILISSLDAPQGTGFGTEVPSTGMQFITKDGQLNAKYQNTVVANMNVTGNPTGCSANVTAGNSNTRGIVSIAANGPTDNKGDIKLTASNGTIKLDAGSSGGTGKIQLTGSELTFNGQPIGGGPDTYIKSAYINHGGNALNLVNQNNTTITFEPQGGSEPDNYIKSATVSSTGNTLTLTKEDDTTISFSPQGGGGGDGLVVINLVGSSGTLDSEAIAALEDDPAKVIFKLKDFEGSSIMGNYIFANEDPDYYTFVKANYFAVYEVRFPDDGTKGLDLSTDGLHINKSDNTYYKGGSGDILFEIGSGLKLNTVPRRMLSAEVGGSSTYVPDPENPLNFSSTTKQEGFFVGTSADAQVLYNNCELLKDNDIHFNMTITLDDVEYEFEKDNCYMGTPDSYYIYGHMPNGSGDSYYASLQVYSNGDWRLNNNIPTEDASSVEFDFSIPVKSYTPMDGHFVPVDGTSITLNNDGQLQTNIPAVPSNTGTYVLKCIDGVLQWVAE